MNADEGALSFDAFIDNSDFKRTIELMRQDVAKLTDTTVQQTSKMDSAFKSFAAGLAGVFTVQQAERFVSQMVRVRSEFQQIDVSLQTMLKSKEKADALLEQVKDLALTTPFNLLDIAQGTKQLLAYGFQANEITDTLRTLGNIASGVSAPLGDIVYLYGTLRTQGRAYTRDIMQFTSRGIPIVEQLAQQFGVTKDKVQDLVQAGKVGFPEIEKAFQAMTNKGGLFYDLMEKQSKTLAGQISNLQDKFSFMLNDIGKSSEGFISGSLGVVAELLEHYKEIFKIIGAIAAGYGVYRAAIIATTIAEQTHLALLRASALASKELNAAQALRLIMLGKLRTAWQLLNATIASNPIGLAVIALTGIVSALILIDNKVESTTDKLKSMRDAAEDFAKTDAGIRKLVNEYNELSEKTSRTEAETQQLHEISKKLADLFPEETGKINNLTGAYEANTKAIIDNQNVKRDTQLQDLFKQRMAYEQQIFALQKDLQLGFKSITNANGTTNSVALKPQDREAIQKDIDTIQKLINGINDAEDTILKGTGTFTIYKPSDIKQVETVADQVGRINKELREQEALLSRQRGPQSTATVDQINTTLTKIKELKKALQTLTGPASALGPAPVKPVLPDLTELGKQGEAALKKSILDMKDPLVDVASDVMKGVTDKWDEAVKTISGFGSLTSSEYAAQNFKKFLDNVFSDPFNDTLGELKGKIADIDKVINTGYSLDGKVKVSPATLEALKNVKHQIEQITHTGDAFWNDMRELTGIFSDIGGSVKDFNEGLAAALDIMSNLVNYGVNFRNSIDDAVKGFKNTGDGVANLMQGITGTLGAVGAAVGVITTVMAALAQRDKDRAADILNQNQLLQEQLGLVNEIYGIERLRAYGDLEKKLSDDRLKNAEALIKKLKDAPKPLSDLRPIGQAMEDALKNNDWEKLIEVAAAASKKHWGDAMQANLKAIQNDSDALKQLAIDWQEAVTGISLDSLTDQITQMFEDGKTSAEDFAETFEDLMKNAIVSTFKTQFLQQQLKGWYDEFSNLSKSDNSLSSNEVSKLQGDLNTIIDNAKKGWDQLQKAAGLDFSAVAGTDTEKSTQGGLAGQIQKSITEDTATQLAGTFNGILLATTGANDTLQKQYNLSTNWYQKQMDALNNSIYYLTKIEANTGKTAGNSEYLPYLKSIDNKLSSDDAKRAVGIK